jgi:hypothetical protein
MMHNIGFRPAPQKRLYAAKPAQSCHLSNKHKKNASYTFMTFLRVTRSTSGKWISIETNNLANIKNYRTYLMTANMISRE